MKKNRIILCMKQCLIVSTSDVRTIYTAHWSGHEPPDTTATRSTEGWSYACTCKASQFSLDCYHKKDFEQYLSAQNITEKKMHYTVHNWRYGSTQTIRSGDTKAWKAWKKNPSWKPATLLIEQMIRDDLLVYDDETWRITRYLSPEEIEPIMTEEQCKKRCEILNENIRIAKRNWQHVQYCERTRPSRKDRFRKAYADAWGACKKFLLGTNREQAIKIAEELQLTHILWQIPGKAPKEEDDDE